MYIIINVSKEQTSRFTIFPSVFNDTGFCSLLFLHLSNLYPIPFHFQVPKVGLMFFFEFFIIF